MSRESTPTFDNGIPVTDMVVTTPVNVENAAIDTAVGIVQNIDIGTLEGQNLPDAPETK